MGERDRDGTRRAPGRPRSQAVDDAILGAALELFVEHGVDGASIERIAKRAGVTRATVYRRWSSKEALLARAVGRLRETMEESFGPWQDMPLDRIVGKMIELAPQAWADDRTRRLLARLIGSVPSAPALMSAYWEAYLEPRRAAFSRIVEKARDEGRLPEETDPDLLQDMLGGAMMLHLLIRPGAPDEAELRDYLVRLLRQLGLFPGKT